MSTSEITKVHLHNDFLPKKEALKNSEAEIIEIIRQRKGLAHEPLYSKINKFESMLPIYEGRDETKVLLTEIFKLVKTRYEELIIQ